MGLNPTKAPSPSRTYVVMCNKGDFSGYYFRKFYLPLTCNSVAGLDRAAEDLENTPATASWFFLNHLDCVACVEDVMAYEDYLNIREA
jgi:hypothetical protein